MPTSPAGLIGRSSFSLEGEPTLTTVRQPIEAIGRVAVTVLVNQIDGVPVQLDDPSVRAGGGSTAPARIRAA